MDYFSHHAFSSWREHPSPWKWESLTCAPDSEVVSNNIPALAMLPSWLLEKINPVLAKTRTEQKLTIITVQVQLEKSKFCFTLSCLQINSLKLNRIQFNEWRVLEWLIMQGWMKSDSFIVIFGTCAVSNRHCERGERKLVVLWFLKIYSFWHFKY